VLPVCCPPKGLFDDARFAAEIIYAWSKPNGRATLSARAAVAQIGPLLREREGRVISLVPYAPNVLRVTMSIERAAATGAPGYGIAAMPSPAGWIHKRDADGTDIFRSTRMVVRVAPGDLPKDQLPQPMPLDDLNMQLREHCFGAGGNPHLHSDGLVVTTAEGKMLLHMRTWMMTPEAAETAAAA
jgi:alpha-D-xyloside xylohydrolase